MHDPDNVLMVRDFYFLAVEDIAKGSEVFSSYGNSDWFQSRGLTELTFPSSVDGNASWKKERDAFETSLPGCPFLLTDVINGRLYAAQNIDIGTVIEVARGLVVAEEITRGNALQNYTWFRRDHPQVAYLLLGKCDT